jgi:hypothetical protein
LNEGFFLLAVGSLLADLESFSALELLPWHSECKQIKELQHLNPICVGMNIQQHMKWKWKILMAL